MNSCHHIWSKCYWETAIPNELNMFVLITLMTKTCIIHLEFLSTPRTTWDFWLFMLLCDILPQCAFLIDDKLAKMTTPHTLWVRLCMMCKVMLTQEWQCAVFFWAFIEFALLFWDMLQRVFLQVSSSAEGFTAGVALESFIFPSGMHVIVVALTLHSRFEECSTVWRFAQIMIMHFQQVGAHLGLRLHCGVAAAHVTHVRLVHIIPAGTSKHNTVLSRWRRGGGSAHLRSSRRAVGAEADTLLDALDGALTVWAGVGLQLVCALG